MKPEDVHNTLHSVFVESNSLFVEYLSLHKQEMEHSQYVQENFPGHILLSTAFESFLFETIKQSNFEVNAIDKKHRPHYNAFVLEFNAYLMTLRAASSVWSNGYPITSFALLRSNKNRSLAIGALGNKFTTLDKLHGFNAVKIINENTIENEIRKAKETEEKRIFKLMIRENTKLAGYREALLRWDRSFNKEVHGESYSTAHLALRAIESGQRLPKIIDIDDGSISFAMNKFVEINFLLLKCLPFLQSNTNSLGQQWIDKWKLLHDIHILYLNGSILDRSKRGKTVGGLIYLAEIMFDFSPQTSSYKEILHEGVSDNLS